MQEFKHGNTKLNSKIFRGGSRADLKAHHFVLAWGGLGDLLGYMSAVVWIAKNYSHVKGQVYCLPFFVEVAENILSSFPKWSVHKITEDTSIFELGKSVTMKNEEIWSAFGYMSYFDRKTDLATGVHMVDAGFLYLVQQLPPTDANFSPELDLSNVAALDLPERYAVMTPGSNSYGLRTMPSKAFNGVKDYFILKGITPVFVGRSVNDEFGVSIHFDEGYNYHGGIDLRDQTTVLQAAKVIQKAEVIVGLDNGLLHLAACTGDVPIVFGYNIVSPELRRPRRKNGHVYDVLPSEEKLPCLFCHSKMRMIDRGDTGQCPYRDLACLDELSDPKLWIEQIAKSLKQGRDEYGME